jgi:hypothetical protein
MLANLSRQTSLEFRRQERAVDVWWVGEDRASTPPPLGPAR